MKRILGLSIILVLFSCAENNKKDAGVIQSPSEDSIEKSTEPTTGIPVLSFESLQPLLQHQNDTTYVVNFWATWCRPCIKELPYFEKVGEMYSDKKVKVLLVSLDFPDKLQKQVIPFIEKNDLKSRVVLLDDPDANSWIPKVSPEWSGAIPATLIYNKENRNFYEKSFTYNELEQAITNVL
jgi:thiol-disulfide isomerase/thioredoxin